jgi:hypothetical protein
MLLTICLSGLQFTCTLVFGGGGLIVGSVEQSYGVDIAASRANFRNTVFTFSWVIKGTDVACVARWAVIRCVLALKLLTEGLITQPLVGAISDRSRLRWGNSSPFPPVPQKQLTLLKAADGRSW